MVLDGVNVGLKDRTRLSFLAVGFFLCNCWRNRPQAVLGLLWIPLAFGEANPQSWKGLWECYCNLLIQNIAGKRLPGMGLEEMGLLSWDELLRLLGWFCPLVVTGLGTPGAKWLPELNKGGSRWSSGEVSGQGSHWLGYDFTCQDLRPSAYKLNGVEHDGTNHEDHNSSAFLQ